MAVQLTPEHETEAWILMDAMEAANARGDAHAQIAAAGALLDFSLRHGLLTRDELRAMAAPHLTEIVGRLDALPAGWQQLNRMRDDAMELLNGDDYAERAGAALFILTMDGVQAPRLAAARAKSDRDGKLQWRSELEGVQRDASQSAQVIWLHAFQSEDVGDHPLPAVEDFREAWKHMRRAHRRAGALLRKMGATPAEEPWFLAWIRGVEVSQ
ncbi:hypothetical protein ABQJ54_03775 [Rhodanobacter sp. Si-c]|uniref:Uncharacterized protein n=1 Tax=Rhodanobacter lycopersici TaxID=3162487 RepID=A0ABV3QAK4_9GAMM